MTLPATPQTQSQQFPESVRVMLRVYDYTPPADWQQREAALTEAVDTYLTVDLALKSALHEHRQLKLEAPVCPVEVEYFIETLIYEHAQAIFNARLDPLEQRIADLQDELSACSHTIRALLPAGIWVHLGDYAVKVADSLYASRPIIITPWGKHRTGRYEQQLGEV